MVLHVQMWLTKISLIRYSSFLDSLPNNTILDWSKLKAFANDKVTHNTYIDFESFVASENKESA